MSKRLLLADDSVTIQKVIGITFANEDYQLDIVDNGDSALEHARGQRPDLVLADVYMPGKNGYELCAAIKQDAELAAVPVILLTGTFEPFDEDKARQAGADTWISKPFESQYLIDQVEELLARVAAAPAAATAPLSEPAAASAASATADESWGDVSVEDDDFLDAADEELTEPAAEGDIWGAVSLDEEDLLLEEDLSAPDAAVTPKAPTVVEPVAAATEPDEAAEDWGDVDDEIFDLEDGDIIDEADLLEAEDAVDEEPPAETGDVEIVTSEDDLLEEEPLDVEPPAAGGWSVPGVEMPELAPEPEPEPGPEPAYAAEPEPLVATESATAEVSEQPETTPADTAEPDVTHAVTLDEEQVAQIVERVATEVVERLAENLLERVAWEVVPDLAESLIKDEIRKIKSNLQ